VLFNTERKFFLSFFFPSFFIPSFLSSFYDFFNPLIEGVEGFWCTWTNSHTHTHTLCRTPLDERSVCRKDVYLTTHNIRKRRTSITLAGFEPVIPISEHPQTHASDGATRRKENSLPQNSDRLVI
jgi:hypothetical protein